MNLKIKGHLFSGRTSASHDAIMTVAGDDVMLETTSGEFISRLSVTELRLFPRLGTIPRTIETASGLRFETSDFAQVEQLETLMGGSRRLHALENKWSVSIAIAASLVVAIVFIYKVLIPSYSMLLAPLVPASVLEKLSGPLEFYLAKVASEPVHLTETDHTRVDQALKDLKSAYPPIGKIDLLQENLPNAFILPNAHVYVTSGLVTTAKTSDEILAVLLHEAGHHAYHHVIQSMIANSSISVLIILITGGTEWTNVPILMLGNSYSRMNETMADDYAVKRMIELHKDPVAFADIFERIQNDHAEIGNVPSFMSTHPSFDDRIKRIHRLKDAATPKN